MTKKKKLNTLPQDGLIKTNTNAVGLPLRQEFPEVNSAKLYKELISHSGFHCRERAQLSIKDQCFPKRVSMAAPQGVQKRRGDYNPQLHQIPQLHSLIILFIFSALNSFSLVIFLVHIKCKEKVHQKGKLSNCVPDVVPKKYTLIVFRPPKEK